jgi:hypothetical protein
MGDEEFDELLEQSSLGSPGAHQLRARVSHDQVALTRRIADLRNRMVHGDQVQARAAAAELRQLLREHNYQASAADVDEDAPGAGPPAEVDVPQRRTLLTPSANSFAPSASSSRVGGRDATVSVAVLPDIAIDDQEARRLVRELRNELLEVDVVSVLTATNPPPGRFEGSVVDVLSVVTTSATLPYLVNTVARWLKHQRNQARVSLTIGSFTIEVMAVMSDEDLRQVYEHLSQIGDR